MKSLLLWLLLPSLFCTACVGLAAYRTGEGPREKWPSFLSPFFACVGGGAVWAFTSSGIVWLTHLSSSNWGWGYWVYFNFIGTLVLSPIPGLVAGFFGLNFREHGRENYVLGVMAGAFLPYALFLLSQFGL